LDNKKNQGRLASRVQEETQKKVQTKEGAQLEPTERKESGDEKETRQTTVGVQYKAMNARSLTTTATKPSRLGGL
jgi:hypothetical protein